MDWTARLNEALGYMEDNLEKTVEIEEAARLANCSLFHFCRMFEVVFGTGPAEYVRRRRLSRAALDLAASKDKVIDVALRYGWESPESFAKAFRRCFGITPSEARQNDIELETWPPIQLAVILKGDKTMKYRIIEKDTIELAGVSLRTTNTDGENMKVIPEFGKRTLQTEPPRRSEKTAVPWVCSAFVTTTTRKTILSPMPSPWKRATTH